MSRLIEVSVKRESTVLTKKLGSFYSGDMKTCPLESSICLSICLARTRLTNTLRPTNSYFSFVCIWIIIFVQSSIYWLVMLYIVFMVNDSIVIFLKQKIPFSFFFWCVVVRFCGVGMITQFFSIFCIILHHFVGICTLLQHLETANFFKKYHFPVIQTQSKTFCGTSQSCLPQMHHLAFLPCNCIHNATNLIFPE